MHFVFEKNYLKNRKHNVSMTRNNEIRKMNTDMFPNVRIFQFATKAFKRINFFRDNIK